MSERIWDRFLTERDKAHLKKMPTRQKGFGERPALLLIDLYRHVFGDRRQPLLEAIDAWPQSCGDAAWDAIPHIQRLLRICRDAQMPIVHVTSLAGTGVNRWPVLRGTTPPSPSKRTDLDEIIPEVGPLPGEAVVRKAGPSAFLGTALVPHLNFHDIDTVIVCGESTSGCVRATVVDARAYSFRVVVVEECVFDRHEAAHAINLFDMDQKYGDVVGVQEVQRYLGGLPSARDTRKAAAA